MKVVEISPGAVGVDFLRPATLAEIRALAQMTLPGTSTKLTFVERYLENLTLAELTGYFAAGLGVLPIGESRANGYVPTSADGDADGAREVAKMFQLGVPLTGPIKPTVGCDLEGMAGSAGDTQAYSIAWCRRVQQYFLAMVYEGAGVPLSPQQLYTLPFTLYYRSLSNVQPVANVDYAMYQGFPTQTLPLPTGPMQADLDVVFRDKRMRAPTMLVGDNWPLAA